MVPTEIAKTEIEEETVEEVGKDRDLKKVEVINNLCERLVKLEESQENQCKKPSILEIYFGMKINEGTAENAEENTMKDDGKEEEGKELEEQNTEEEAEERHQKNIIPTGSESDSGESHTYSSHMIEERCCRPDSPRSHNVSPV